MENERQQDAYMAHGEFDAFLKNAVADYAAGL
jgi:hypothetical protein